MSKLTDRISYLQGLAEGMKLNPDKDSHKLILGILEVLGEVGDAFDALAEAHGELNDYVESIDEDLADLEANLYDEADEACDGDCENCDDEECEYSANEMLYECPHCGAEIEIDPDQDDFDEDALCPHCGKSLFPELPEEVDGDPEDAEDSEE
jgi:DNA-directed RNA polymerase subunit RPC12/RpoP